MNNECPFKVGDLVVDKLSDYKYNKFYICKIINIEYVDQYSDMWFEEVDKSPFWFFETEAVYVKQDPRYVVELGDIICYEDHEIITLEEYLNQKPITVNDYIQFRNSLY